MIGKTMAAIHAKEGSKEAPAPVQNPQVRPFASLQRSMSFLELKLTEFECAAHCDRIDET
jgi:hypothetical protein